MTYLIIGLVALSGILLKLLLGKSEAVGQVVEQNKSQAEVLKDAKNAAEIHDRLNADPDFANRVRDRFTRD